jgi:hypothetical protein
VTGVERRRSVASASAAVERRQASALRFRARAAPRWVRLLSTRLSAFRLPFFFLYLLSVQDLLSVQGKAIQPGGLWWLRPAELTEELRSGSASPLSLLP